ncbi:tetraacyldisaccharide 4'-kinase [Winogradskyella sp. PC-19]|uniref:tetraacyldisaccharide 4'-kinase n=1 Tax=unclassified Winogradskyella TaxID=2615021 RepID=UPI000B3D41FE|nr:MULTISPECIES: tetraacyldisaccharide 4'-kinase [unclassified Winogradskyella]ARV10281.1 tetraacyldisaccharide 4'-kinase [Winogradskyella sp. PC-19]RZN77962.1 MAG: tetraacyldisaccharide 4'-kinase [Winogradskyella sp.]
MKILRILLFPIVPIYFFVTWLRNRFYDSGVKPSQSYDFPVICVGNLSTGGTGKTPMIEYLIRLLQSDKKVATLSRGYKRVTKGFLLADENVNVDMVGDEPFQFYNKFNDIYVAVDEDRQHGITELRSFEPQPEVVLLDDAYQHRKVKAGFNILLTSFGKLYTIDMVLPTGNLREPKSGAKRANVIVVTKCPNDLTEDKKASIIRRINPKNYQSVFFSSIKYCDTIYSSESEMSLETLSTFTLVTGIANATPLVKYLKSKTLDFEHLEYGDHYNFTIKDIELLEQKELILTTEKDYMRLLEVESLRSKLYYISIEVTLDKPLTFDSLIKDFVN